MKIDLKSKFSQVTDEYLKISKIRDTKATIKKKTGYIKRINKFMGDIECSSIDKALIYDFIIYRKEINPNISNKTLNMYVVQITSVLKEMLDIDLNFKKLRETKKLPQILDDITIQKVYKYLSKYKIKEHRRNKLMFMMLLDTGLRISELLSLKLNDIDIENRVILVKDTKNKEYRQVLFTKETQSFISNYVIDLQIKEHLFINFETLKPIRTDSVETICRRIQKKANIKKSISPHKWRHTFASNFIDNNGNMFVLMKLLGHKDIKTTQIYVTVSMKKVVEEYDRVVE